MNISEQLSQGSKEYGAGSTMDYFKFEKGENRLRILTAGEVIATHFFGKGQKAHTCYGMEKGCPFHGDKAPKDDKGKEKKPSIKYTCYLIDVKDTEKKVQMADLPYSVIKQVGEYQTNIDYAFETFPMPYDITVKFDPDTNVPNDMYKVLPSPKQTPVDKEVLEALEEKMATLTPAQSVAKKKEWQVAQHEKDGVIKKETRAEWVARVNKEQESKIASGEIKAEDKIEYPEEEIDPKDIPF